MNSQESCQIIFNIYVGFKEAGYNSWHMFNDLHLYLYILSFERTVLNALEVYPLIMHNWYVSNIFVDTPNVKEYSDLFCSCCPHDEWGEYSFRSALYINRVSPTPQWKPWEWLYHAIRGATKLFDKHSIQASSKLNIKIPAFRQGDSPHKKTVMRRALPYVKIIMQ